MADANRTLLVEMLSRRIHFETEAGGLRFQHSGVLSPGSALLMGTRRTLATRF